ncbi:MAG: pilus assembly protein TadG-related protein [Actinomycetota bacterium]
MSIVVAFLVCIAALSCTAITEVGALAAARARAQAAADLGALAAAAEQGAVFAQRSPEAAARETVERNGAHLVLCRCPPGGRDAVVRATVTLDLQLPGLAPIEVGASARAEMVGQGRGGSDESGGSDHR